MIPRIFDASAALGMTLREEVLEKKTRRVSKPFGSDIANVSSPFTGKATQ
jgi:hypothetical protein